jgi:hypothetical protein
MEKARLSRDAEFVNERTAKQYLISAFYFDSPAPHAHLAIRFSQRMICLGSRHSPWLSFQLFLQTVSTKVFSTLEKRAIPLKTTANVMETDSIAA